VGENEKTWIVLKMDIEGSEYSVLRHLLEEGVAKKVDAFLVEFHPWFKPGNRQLEEELTEDYKKLGISFKKWV